MCGYYFQQSQYFANSIKSQHIIDIREENILVHALFSSCYNSISILCTFICLLVVLWHCLTGAMVVFRFISDGQQYPKTSMIWTTYSSTLSQDINIVHSYPLRHFLNVFYFADKSCYIFITIVITTWTQSKLEQLFHIVSIYSRPRVKHVNSHW